MFFKAIFSIENGKGVVVMANTYNTILLDEIINSIASVYNWKDFYTPEKKSVVTVNNEILKSYTGKYKLNKDTLTITLERQGLMIRFNSKEKYNVYFTSDTNFLILEAIGAEQKFTKDGKNKINGFQINDNGHEMEAVKIEQENKYRQLANVRF